MNGKKRRNFSGAFAAIDRGNGAWQLDSAAPQEISIYLQNAEPGAARAFGEGTLEDLNIEWHADSAQLSFTAGSRPATVKIAGAIVHEPLGFLYDGLPLASIDADARRFWRRVFRLVRIPGGRYLLRLLTRSRRH